MSVFCNSFVMRFLSFFCLFFFLFSVVGWGKWQKINQVDYEWGPFIIYHIALFSETGEYHQGIRPVMLSLHYQKPVEGRDFAISLVRSWNSLGLVLPQQDEVVDSLRKSLPNLKKGDRLHFIALPEKGYFVLNNQVLEPVFNVEFSQAILAVWLEEQVEIGQALLNAPNLALQGGEKNEENAKKFDASEAMVSDNQEDPDGFEFWDIMDPVFLYRQPVAYWQQIEEKIVNFINMLQYDHNSPKFV